MLNRIRKFSEEREQGFTLIELLVVIIIIGILAAIAIPVFLNQRKKGVDAGLKSDLKNAATAAETFSADNPTAVEFAPLAGNIPVALRDAGYIRTPGTIIEVKGGPAIGYCFRARSDSGSTGASEWFHYDSTGGGLFGTKTTKAGSATSACGDTDAGFFRAY